MNSNAGNVWPHLAELPAFRALIRSIEHRLLAGFQPLRAPVLDVGAGDGHFASVVFQGAIDVGMDVDLAAMREAQRRKAYRLLLSADATRLPLGSESFSTVISNCVLEHIPDLEAVLKELFRILRPGGTLLLTVPTVYLERNLCVPQVLRSFGWPSAAERYIGWFRRVQVHYHLLPREGWIRAVSGPGFEIVATRGYLSRRATRAFELWHYAGWHNLLARRLTGRWVVWPWRPRFAIAERWISGFSAEPEHSDDSCLLVAARKPGRMAVQLVHTAR